MIKATQNSFQNLTLDKLENMFSSKDAIYQKNSDSTMIQSSIIGWTTCSWKEISYILICRFFFTFVYQMWDGFCCYYCPLAMNKMCLEGWRYTEMLWQNSLSPIFATSAHDSFQNGMQSVLSLLLSLTFFFPLFRAYCIAKGFPIHYWWNHRPCHVNLHNFIHFKMEINLKRGRSGECVQTSWF